ncbi:MAG: DUF4411 family protein [Accumulibacter sp.]|jgi:hypothetical protein|uniref:DUF4411 family protein n=1 Tax=Accumulibacter sp. TaxID=2053492 RepID=UPI001A591F40|nr:DUF4411 family protein [Accumulibacter sp.]
MKKRAVYVLDSDVFIAAKNAYYSFDICPGFWDAIVQAYRHDRVRSIDRIKAELVAGQPKEDLVVWVKETVPAGFFHGTQAKAVLDAYTEIALWVQRSTQYLDRAKAKFATEADGWLVAYCMVHGTCVVTNEQPRPDSRSRVLLPDVCTQFKVPSKDTFTMLRSLAVKLDLRAQEAT